MNEKGANGGIEMLPPAQGYLGGASIAGAGHQVISDGITVWVNAPNGECLARFGRLGVDVHRTIAEQIEGMPQCLECTHGPTTDAEWALFKAAVWNNYAVVVDDVHKPIHLAIRTDAHKKAAP